MLKIFTLHWNKKDTIKELYLSFMPSLSGLEWEWWIKDNGSTDGSIDEIKSWDNPNIKLIEYGNNKLNYSQGMNYLFDESKPLDDDLILTLNNDIVFNDDSSIKNMISLIKADKKIGVVGAKLNYKNSNKIQHCGVLFHHYNWLPFHYRSKQEELPRDKVNRYYPAVTGAVSLITTEAFREARFNDKLIWCFDDIDFCFRVKYLLGKDIVYCGETHISHEESASLKNNPINKMFIHHNANSFLQAWKKYIDIDCTLEYQDPNYNLYRSPNE